MTDGNESGTGQEDWPGKVQDILRSSARYFASKIGSKPEDMTEWKAADLLDAKDAEIDGLSDQVATLNKAMGRRLEEIGEIGLVGLRHHAAAMSEKDAEIKRLKRELDDALRALSAYGYDGNTRCSICGDRIIGSMVGNGLGSKGPEWRHEECDEHGSRALKDADSTNRNALADTPSTHDRIIGEANKGGRDA